MHQRVWLFGLLGIFLLALALRSYAVARFSTVPFSDGADYHELASHLARGDGYVTSIRRYDFDEKTPGSRAPVVSASRKPLYSA